MYLPNIRAYLDVFTLASTICDVCVGLLFSAVRGTTS